MTYCTVYIHILSNIFFQFCIEIDGETILQRSKNMVQHNIDLHSVFTFTAFDDLSLLLEFYVYFFLHLCMMINMIFLCCCLTIIFSLFMFSCRRFPISYVGNIEEGFIQKKRQRSSLRLGGQNLFNSLPRQLFCTRPIGRIR